MAHQRRMHRTEPAIDWNRLPVSQTEYLPHAFDIIFPKGHLPVLIKIPRLTRVVPYLERPPEPLQPKTLGE